MYKYYNANPLQKRVNDCTVRALSCAKDMSWDEAYNHLSLTAQEKATMPDDVEYIDEYLNENFKRICGCKGNIRITVGEFVDTHPQGTYLITMRGHITCAIDGCIYDTFDPSDRYVWGAYKVKQRGKSLSIFISIQYKKPF